MDREMMYDIFDLYSDEFDTRSFTGCGEESLLQLLLIYKHRLGIDFTHNGVPMSFQMVSSDDDACYPNAIIVGGKYAESKGLAADELTSGFLNASAGIEDDNIKFCIYSDSENAIVNITKGADQRIYDYGTRQMFMSVITKLLPWHFKDLNEEQMEVVRSVALKVIARDGIVQIEDEFERVMNEQGVLRRLQRVKLEKMGEQIAANRKRNIEDELLYKQSDAQDLDTRLMQLCSEIRELKIQLSAIENSRDEFDNPINEMLDFIDNAPYNIMIDRVDNDHVILKYKLTLNEYTSRDEYIAMIRNGTSSSMFLRAFNDLCDEYSTDAVKEAYKRIMDTKECKVWVAGLVDVDMYRYGVRVETDIDVDHCMRHPHLNGDISCFGTARDMISGYLKQGRLAEAMNAIAFATQQCTLADSYAMGNLIDGIKRKKCIECQDGEYRTFKELVKAISKEEI